MNKCPLLLKYKLRSPYDCNEIQIDVNAGEAAGNWNQYDEPKYEMWNLQLPGSQDFLTSANGNIKYFFRVEIQLIGNPDPIAIRFNETEWRTASPVNIYQLPPDYDSMENNWYHIFDDMPYIRSILQEYERHRNEWKPRVVVRNEGEKK